MRLAAFTGDGAEGLAIETPDGWRGRKAGDPAYPGRLHALIAGGPEALAKGAEALRGVVKFPVRIKCATLSWNTLAQAIDEARA